MNFKDECYADVANLVFRHRWAALATMNATQPAASMVAYAPYYSENCLLFLLSKLAPHTDQLIKNSECSLVISQQDDGVCDPQTLSRISFNGSVSQVSRHKSVFSELKQIYCSCLPASERLFGFADFSLFQFRPKLGRYVGGFGRAYNLSERHIDMIFTIKEQGV